MTDKTRRSISNCSQSLSQSSLADRTVKRLLLVTLLATFCSASVNAQDGNVHPKVIVPPGAKACQPTISPEMTETDYRAKSLSFTVRLPSGCNWSVTRWPDRFIATPNPLNGSGTRAIRLNINANDKPGKRSGTLVIAGYIPDGRKRWNATYAVRQAGRPRQ